MAEPRSTAAGPGAIRTPPAFRVFVAVYFAGWTGGVAAFASEYHSQLTLAVLVLLVPFAFAVAYRSVRVSVTCYDDHLLVRNLFRMHRVARSDITGFRIGRNVNRRSTLTIYARLRDGTVLPMDVAWSFLYFGHGMPLDDQLRLLRAWLARSVLT
jgi:hypothetical protein